MMFPSLRPALPLLLLLAAAALPCATAADTLTVSVLRQGLFEGYPANTRNQDGKPVYFESSAVATDGTSIWFTGDKPAPSTKLSSVVRVPLASLREKSVVPWSDATPVMAPEFRHTQKIESTALTESGLRFSATAFDRFVPDTKIADAWNIVVAWQGDTMDKAVVVNPSTRYEMTSSLGLRAPILAALKEPAWPDGPPYIKIEGLAALPGSRLWFGVRESGKDGRKPENFRYRFTILETTWTEANGQVTIRPEFHKVLDAAPQQLSAAGITGVVGLSSLEYDPQRKIVWAVASWEEAETETVREENTRNGSWLLALTAPAAGITPAVLPVHGTDGKPVSFTHKVEGLSVAGARELLLVSDEDRRATVVRTPDGPKTREPHMGIWTLVDIVTP